MSFIMLVFNVALPEGSKVTRIQCYFLSLPVTCRDCLLYSFSQSVESQDLTVLNVLCSYTHISGLYGEIVCNEAAVMDVS